MSSSGPTAPSRGAIILIDEPKSKWSFPRKEKKSAAESVNPSAAQYKVSAKSKYLPKFMIKDDFEYPEHLKDPSKRCGSMIRAFFFMLATQLASREARRAIACFVTFFVLSMFIRNYERSSTMMADKQECFANEYVKIMNETNSIGQNISTDTQEGMTAQQSCLANQLQGYEITTTAIKDQSRIIEAEIRQLNFFGAPVPQADVIADALKGSVVDAMNTLTGQLFAPSLSFSMNSVPVTVGTNADEVKKEAQEDQKSYADVLKAINWTQLALMLLSWGWLLWVAYDLVFKAVHVKWRTRKQWIKYLKRHYDKILTKAMVYLLYVAFWYFILFTQYVIQVLAKYSAMLKVKPSTARVNSKIAVSNCGVPGSNNEKDTPLLLNVDCAQDFEIESIPTVVHILIWTWYFYPLINLIIQWFSQLMMGKYPEYFETGQLAKKRKESRRKYKDEALYGEDAW